MAQSKAVLKEMQEAFRETREVWREIALNDREYGRKKIDRSLMLAAQARDALVPRKRVKAFNEMLRVTGVGDHPEMIRLMYRAGKYLESGTMMVPMPRQRRKRKKRK